jgi:aspartate 1-decarboxylase
MLRSICHAKIHRMTVTRTDLNYEGSISIDTDLLRAADIVPYEKVQVVNLHNGQRFETYIIEGKQGSGEVGLNGAAARLGEPGDKIIVIAYALFEDKERSTYTPKIIHVDEKNRVVKR